MIFGIITVVLFFYYFAKISIRWADIPERLFKKKLFRTALGIRLLSVVFFYFFFIYLYGQPFEFEARDSLTYHKIATNVSSQIEAGNYNIIEAIPLESFADKGYPFYLSILYYIFGDSVLPTRIINSILGAIVCVLIYKLARRNFGDKTARIASILTMLLPNLIYYTALHLKETTMIFLLVLLIERTDYMLRTKHNTYSIYLIVGILAASLFYFRTALGVAAIFSIGSAIIFSSRRILGYGKRILIISWLTITAFILFSNVVAEEINQLIENSDTNQENSMVYRATRKGGNKLAQMGSAVIFAPQMFIAPYPTLVDIDYQKNQMMLNGAYFTKNVYAFFVLIALISLFKSKQLKNHVLLLSILSSYLGILSLSGFALSERFHLPMLPFLAIFTAYGLTKIDQRKSRYFIPYLIFISAIILIWNWFKLAGRGML